MRRSGLVCVLLLACTAAALSWAAEKDKDEAFIGKRRAFWSFQTPVRPSVPDVQSGWVRTPIDAFILQALQAKQLSPSPALSREKLLRRVTLDLTGLPPTPSELDLFLRDTSPDAYEKVVDRLLASPHYGERWGQRWLDVVRYADTNGYELDVERPHAWRYRDYVVRSFNQDKPYGRFLQEQIAGDELWPGNSEALLATGFHRAGPIHLVGGNQDKDELRQEVLTEMTTGVTSTFLGLTVQCARCHNHKFDPILQTDFYRLQSLFAGTEGKDIEIGSGKDKIRQYWAQKAYEAELAPIKKQIGDIEKPSRDRLIAEAKAKLDEPLRVALDTPEAQRTPAQKELAKTANSQIKPTWDVVVAALSPADREKRAALRRHLHEIESRQPEPVPTAYAVANLNEAPVTHVLKIGDYRQKLDPVEPGLVRVIEASSAPSVPAAAQGRRAALAQWLASPDHPLTWRVMANRIWQFRMGRGIVRTPNDFGALGERPTNPALLDWLATELQSNGGSVKAIDRLIVLSNVYRQVTSDDAARRAIDPENKLYWRAHRRRLEGEAIRDSALAVSGLLQPQIGGPPIRTAIEPEVYDIIFTEDEPDNLWPLPRDPKQQNRRSLYLLNKRNVRLPMLANFDQPDAMSSCPVRPTSTHALQSLSLMNSDFMNQQAQAFAQRLERECGGNNDCRIRYAFTLTLARQPEPAEWQLARDFFSKQHGQWPDFCLALLNRNEFVYLP